MIGGRAVWYLGLFHFDMIQNIGCTFDCKPCMYFRDKGVIVVYITFFILGEWKQITFVIIVNYVCYCFVKFENI
jgi:hypothetical protein